MNYKRFTIHIIVLASAYASIIGLYLTWWPNPASRPQWHTAIIIAVGLLYLWFVVKEALAVSKESHRTFSSTRKINKYMSRWVSNRGRTLILSRDMSWGTSFETKSTLLSKAKNKELIIFMQHQTPLSQELTNAGAEIHYYGDLFNPLSRFTIVGAGKDGSRIAVGTERKGKHIVYEYDRGEHPIMAISDDLVELLRKLSQ